MSMFQIAELREIEGLGALAFYVTATGSTLYYDASYSKTFTQPPRVTAKNLLISQTVKEA